MVELGGVPTPNTSTVKVGVGVTVGVAGHGVGVAKPLDGDMPAGLGSGVGQTVAVGAGVFDGTGVAVGGVTDTCVVMVGAGVRMSAPSTKVDAVRRYGGEPVLVPMEEVFRFLQGHLWEQEPYAFIHPWTNRNVMIGHGTIGLEIMADLPQIDSLYVPVGGGGLMSGVGSAVKALKPSVRVVAVEPKGWPALHESFRQGRPAAVECKTMCDGVAVPYITDEVFPILQKIVDDVVLVSEDSVKATIKRLALGNRIIVEGAAALSVAAALETPAEKRGQTVCLVTGGSIDTNKLLEILADTTPASYYPVL